MAEDAQKCGGCAFLNIEGKKIPTPTVTSDGGQWYLCRRYPRSVPKNERDWCGEFQERDPEWKGPN